MPGFRAASSLVVVNNLRKICCAPSLLQPDTSNPVNWRNSGKLCVLAELLQHVKTKSSDRFVLISNFTVSYLLSRCLFRCSKRVMWLLMQSVLNIFVTLLRELNMTFLRLDGSCPANRRQDLVEKCASSHKSHSSFAAVELFFPLACLGSTISTVATLRFF